MRLGAIVGATALALCAAGVAFGFGMRGFVVGNGGASATPSTNGVYKLYGTVGHPVGRSQNATFRLCSGFWCFGGSQVLDVDPPGGARLATEFALGPARPNPAWDEARFHLALPKEATVTLSVYDVSGRQVGEPASERLAAGEHELVWRPVSQRAGVYFAQLATDGVIRAKRMFVMVR